VVRRPSTLSKDICGRNIPGPRVRWLIDRLIDHPGIPWVSHILDRDRGQLADAERLFPALLSTPHLWTQQWKNRGQTRDSGDNYPQAVDILGTRKES